MTLIYKIVPKSLWTEAEIAGYFEGAPVDVRDGFIHFSTHRQVMETAAKHFKGQDDLLLVAYSAENLGFGLKWEVSRGGDVFPHFYGALDPKAAETVAPLALGPDGAHDFSALGLVALSSGERKS